MLYFPLVKILKFLLGLLPVTVVIVVRALVAGGDILAVRKMPLTELAVGKSPAMGVSRTSRGRPRRRRMTRTVLSVRLSTATSQVRLSTCLTQTAMGQDMSALSPRVAAIIPGWMPLPPSL